MTQTHYENDIKLVALDLDGTLLTDDKTISKRNLDSIAKVIDQGIKVVLASARPPRSVKAIYNRLNLDTTSIHYNGAMLYHFQREQVVSHNPLCQNITRELILCARNIARNCIVSLEVLDKWITDRTDPKWNTETGKSFKPDIIGPLDDHLHQPVTKLMILGEPADMRKIHRAYHSDFVGQASVAISDDHLLQVMQFQVDKAMGLETVMAEHDINWNSVLAIGDAPNDLEMVTKARIGVAVNNAWNDVKSAANVVVANNNDDGVAQALEQYILNR